MMHDGGWLEMSGMGSHWLVPVLIVVLAVVAWGLCATTRSRDNAS